MRVLLLLIRTFIIRDLLFNKVRTVLTILGVALGVAVMLAINLANNTALSRFQDSINLVAGKTNLEIASNSAPDMDERLLSKLAFLWDDYALFTPVIDQLAIASTPNKASDVVQVLGVDMFADVDFRPFALQGGGKTLSGTDIFNANFAYVGDKFAAERGLAKGSKFKLLVDDTEKELTVADILTYSGLGKAFGGNVLLMDIGPAQELFAMKGRINRVDIIVSGEKASPAATIVAGTAITASATAASTAAIEDIAAKLRAVLPADITVQPPARRGAQVQKMLAAFQYNLAALSLIALLVGMFLIYNTMSITIIRKRVEIGVLRALGAARVHIFLIFLMQASILGATGSLLGVGLGLVFARGAIKAVGRTVQALYIDQPNADISFSATTLVVAFAAGWLLTVVAALAPVWEAMSVTPGEASRRASYELKISRSSGKLARCGCLLLLLAALTSLAPSINGFPVCGYLAAALIIFGVALCLPSIIAGLIFWLRPLMHSLFGSEGKLAILSLGGSLGRTAVTVASLMLGIAMMVSLAVMIGSFRQTVIVWVNQTLQADLYVEPAGRAISNRVGRLSNTVVERIRQLPGVEDVDSFVEFPITYQGRLTNFGAGDLGVLMRHGRLLFVNGEDSRSLLARLLGRQACVVSESFALRNGVKKGNMLTLNSPRGRFSIMVDGIYYDYASDLGYIIVSRSLYRQYFDDTVSTTLGVYLKPQVDIEQVRLAMIKTLGGNVRLNVRTNRELRSEVLRVFDNTFAITYALHGISILVAILGVMNALFALTFEMRRDFAILKYIGASVGQLRKIILLQAGTLGLFGTVAGMFVGIVLSFLLINVINKQSFGWTIQLAVPVVFLIQSFILLMVFSLLSGILPAHAATKSISAEAVRCE